MVDIVPMTRVLILYIVRNSGHHAAARALEMAFRRCAPATETLCVDLLKYTHPKWENIIQRMYMTTIRRTPELWNALYDSFWIEYLTRRLRQMIQAGKGEALRRLMTEFDPHAVLCTQAYPFAVLSSFAARWKPDLPLFGVTTDFIPHRFWISNGHSNVHYVVPTDAAAVRLMWLGIGRERIHCLGIPVCVDHPPVSAAATPERRRVLVMGGSRGIGIRYRTVQRLDRCPEPFTIDVVCGTNARLRHALARNRRRFRHPIRIRGYVRSALPLMARAELVITKPGGMTLAEAVCIGAPLVLVNPLPGQERGNTEVMVHHGAALHVGNECDVTRSVSTLLNNQNLLTAMREKALRLAHPDAAGRIVRAAIEEIRRGERA